jgi:hypothetical protein
MGREFLARSAQPFGRALSAAPILGKHFLVSSLLLVTLRPPPALAAPVLATHVASSRAPFKQAATAQATCGQSGPRQVPAYATMSLPAGTNPSGTALGDFNHDGHLDLAVSNNASNTLDIYLGQGDGTFSAPTSYPLGAYSQQIALADFDHDGNLDLAIAISGANNITVYRGDGSGRFTLAGQFPTLPRPLSVAVGDFDGDGALDIATQSLDANSVSVLWGDGSGGFSSRSDFAVGDFPNFVVAADLNGDSLPDLVTTNHNSDTVSVLLSLGARQFRPALSIPVGRGPDSVAAADFNRDGRVDLAVTANLANEVDILLGTGDGSFRATTPLTGIDQGPHMIVAEDVNGDGIPDLLFDNNSSPIDFRTLSIALGDGAGGFASPVSFPVGEQANYFAVGDINGDGVPDAAVPNLNTNDVTILASLPPCPPPVAHAGPDQILVAGADCHAVAALDGTASFDPDGDALTYVWTWSGPTLSGPRPTVSLGLGDYRFVLRVADPAGAAATDTVVVRVVDATPPFITGLSATPNILWPPNHKMVAVSIAITAVDACSPPTVCAISGITSSEPASGDASEWIVTGALTAQLRAERSGEGPGRLYTIEAKCNDSVGNAATGFVQVSVPHNQ